jgi:hypothetical protein
MARFFASVYRCQERNYSRQRHLRLATMPRSASAAVMFAAAGKPDAELYLSRQQLL